MAGLSARWAPIPYGPNASSGRGGFSYPYVNHVDFEGVTVEWPSTSNEFEPIQGYVTRGMQPSPKRPST